MAVDIKLEAIELSTPLLEAATSISPIGTGLFPTWMLVEMQKSSLNSEIGSSEGCQLDNTPPTSFKCACLLH
jgi:hypothetical protein